MNRLNPRLFIPLGAALVVVLLWFVALWGPQGSALSKAKKRTEEATAKRDTLRSQLTRLQQSRQDLPLKQSQLETLRVAIPDDPSLAQFILDANDAASKAGIEFLSITPTPPTAAGAATTPTTVAGAAPGGPAPSSIKIAMNITGGYFQVLDFVNRLNRLPRIVVVDALNISAAAIATGAAAPSGGAAAAPAAAPGTLTVSLQARIFTTTQQPVSGSNAAPAAGGAGATTTTTGAGGTTTTTAAGGTTATTRP